MTVILAFVIWAILLTAVILGSFLYFPATTQEGLKDFFAAATIGCAAVTAALGAIVSVVASRSLEAKKQELATDLEGKKNELARTLSEHSEKLHRQSAKELADYGQELQKELQKLKSGSDRQMEMMKATTLSREIEAYQELFSAAAQYYSALSKLETNAWTMQDSEGGESAMQKARSKAPYLKSDEHRKAWEAIWTKAAFITSLAQKLHPDQQSDLWVKNVGEFGTMLKAFENIVTTEFPRP
jgi:hypothetical protein